MQPTLKRNRPIPTNSHGAPHPGVNEKRSERLEAVHSLPPTPGEKPAGHDSKMKTSQLGENPTTNANRPLADVTEDLRTALKRETADVIKIGSLLAEAKGQVGHGNWLPWLEKEFAMSERSAERYIRAHEFAKSANVADLKLRVTALYLLSEGKFDSDETDAIFKAAETQWVGAQKAERIVAALKSKSKPMLHASGNPTPEPPPADAKVPVAPDNEVARNIPHAH